MKAKSLQLLNLLATCLRRETIFQSSLSSTVNNRYYKGIVALGKNHPDIVLPWLFNNLIMPNDGFIGPGWDIVMALSNIVPKQERPIFPEGSAGHFDILVKIWLEWGRIRNYL